MKLLSTSTRLGRAKTNIYASFGSQIIIIICGLIVPRMMIGAFGSEAYGAVTSISQFLAYITLLEGGIGGVARAALYKPLAEANGQAVSSIFVEIRHFFRIVAFVFLAYILILAVFFKDISHVSCFDRITTAVLVIVISISIFAQYFIGITNAVLLIADQKLYIVDVVTITSTILNTAAIAALILCGSNIVIVKLASSFVFIIRPVFLALYVKKHYNLDYKAKRNVEALEQKWVGLGQHIAYFLHTNTDVAILTIFANLKLVAVYSVYYMIVGQIQNFISSFSSGMEAVFGDMLAKKEDENLQKSFSYYETLLSVVASILLSTTIVLIVPFVRLYTIGINDANYINPLFAILMSFTSAVYCFRQPCHSMIIAAGHFRQTQIAAYGEAIINVVFSIILVIKFELVGVAVASLIAVLFRYLYYIHYLSRNILLRCISHFVKRIVINTLIIAICSLLGSYIVFLLAITSWLKWIVSGIIVTIASSVITIGIYYVFYQDDIRGLAKKIF